MNTFKYRFNTKHLLTSYISNELIMAKQEEPGVEPKDEPGVKPKDEPGALEPKDEHEVDPKMNLESNQKMNLRWIFIQNQRQEEAF